MNLNRRLADRGVFSTLSLSSLMLPLDDNATNITMLLEDRVEQAIA